MFLFGSVESWGQQSDEVSYSGKVITPNGAPLAGVIVQVCNSEGLTIAYTRVTKHGDFSLRLAKALIPAEGKLVFRLLGYSSVSIPLSEWRDGRHIELQEEVITLPEVVYTAQKIEVASDTLTYQMAAFKQKQDKVLADVLRKMPGIEVSSTGAISYQGRYINKFYVEGMDLMGKGYATLSKNLDASAVQKVEVLRNHQPISLLDGLSFSDRAALNIILKDEVKGAWSIRLDLGAGASATSKPQFLREGRGVLFQFAKRFQSFTLLKSNNTGIDAGGSILDQIRGEGMEGSSAEFLLSHPSITTSGISAERYRMNDSHFGSSNWLSKTRSGHFIRVQAKLLTDKAAIQQAKSRTFLQTEPRYTLQEQYDVGRRQARGSIATTYEVNQRHLYLKSDIMGYAGRRLSRGETRWWQGDDAVPNVDRSQHMVWQSDEWGAKQDLVLMRRIGAGQQYVTLESHAEYQQIPEELLINGGQLQRSLGKKLSWNSFLKMGHSLSRFNLTYHLGVTHIREKLLLHHAQTTVGDFSYSRWAPYLQSSLSLERGAWMLRARCSATWLIQQLGQKGYQHLLLFDPFLYLKYQVSGMLAFSLRASRNSLPTSLYDVLEVPYYTSYNSRRIGIGKAEQQVSHSITLRSEYARPSQSFFSHLQVSYVTMDNLPLYYFDISPDGVGTFTASSLRDRSQTVNFSGRMGKGIGWGLLTMAVAPSYQVSKYALLLSGSHTTPHLFRSEQGSLGLEVHFHPFPMFSLEGLSSFRYYRLFREEGDRKMLSQKSFAQKLSLFFMPASWRLQWDNHLYYNSDESDPCTLFIDLALSYERSKYEMGIKCQNLLDSHTYNHRWLSSDLEQSSLTFLRPRSLLFWISFRL